MILGRPRNSSERLYSANAVEMARLQGESDGRLFARIDERRRIVQWLLLQKSGTPQDLATRINNGET